MKKLVAAVLALSVVAALAATAFAATTTIKVGDDFFSPKTKTVSRNTTVVWKNVGRTSHTVTVSKGPVKFNKAPLTRGKSYPRKMTRAGTYTIICRYHDGQRMTLKVR